MKVRHEWERLHPYPRGWYVLDVASDLKPGDLRRTAFMGREVVYFRTESGAISVLDAYCSHMGAHIGHGGRVSGETVVCPFHGFAYDVTGRLVDVPGLKTCPTLRQKRYPTDVVWGYLLVYFDPEGNEPTWRVPNSFDMGRWTTPTLDHAIMDVHPVDVAENAVDHRHFHVLHHNNFDLLRSGPLDDHTFNVLYQGHIIERTGIANAWRRFAKGAQVENFLFGVGMLNARVWMPKLGLRFNFVVSPLPLDENRTQLQIGLSAKCYADLTETGLLKNPWARRVLRAVGLSDDGSIPIPALPHLFPMFRRDIVRVQLEDAPVWANKVYVANPRFVDPPVRQYREWAGRFVQPYHPETKLGVGSRRTA